LIEEFKRVVLAMKAEDNHNLKNLENAIIVFGRYSRIDENGNLVIISFTFLRSC
jgi:hypothetical protein